MRPRVVLAHGDLPILFSVIGKIFVHTRIPIYAISHGTAGFVFEEKKSLRHRLLKYAVRRSFRYADIVIAVSRGLAEQLVSSLLLEQDRIRAIYNGVDIERIGSLSKEQGRSFFSDQRGPLIIGVGRLNPQKNFALLIRAVALVIKQRACRLLILGEGSERPSLEGLCCKLNVGNVVAMPGFVANPFAYMAEASVFVLSSIHEGLPTVLIEAMACGTPVVSTDCPAGPREILSDGRYGSLVPMNDVEALATAILNTLEHPLPADVLKARAQYFSLEAYIDAYQKLLAPYMAKGEEI
jgi:glycosyltransferase involved in cell wall biosynthesis